MSAAVADFHEVRVEQNVYIKTLGCKVNTYDSHALENQFRQRGYVIVERPEDAGIAIINTCSVTENAAKEARYLLRKFHKSNPAALRVVTGCYAQIDSATLAELDEVDFVVPNEAKELLVSLVDQGLKAPGGLKGKIGKIPLGLEAVRENKQSHFKSSLTLFDRASSEQTRAFIKIQDGCNGFCSYCQIPYARGSSRSVQPTLILDEIKKLVSEGTKEIVFAGIHIGDYGEDLPLYQNSQEPPIADLLRKTLEIDGICRIRISSLEPAEFTPELASLMEQNKSIFCNHFHFPLQSGSDRILKLMNRKYSSSRYRESVEMARAIFPDAFIGCDIIPGFPGETDEEFNETMDFIGSLNLTALHVFPYSKRPNTAAFKMANHIPGEVVKKRAQIMRAWSSQSTAKYYHGFLGHTLQVLWEKEIDKDGRILGKTTNYLNIAAPKTSEIIPGTMGTVRIKGLLGNEKLLGMPI